MKRRKPKNKEAKQTTLKVLTAVAAAFLKEKHGLFLEVEGNKWLIHNYEGRIFIDDAKDFPNFQHGLHIRLKEEGDDVIPTIPKPKHVIQIEEPSRIIKP